ncbi:hypothetical protein K3495_g13320, partial [Podosphaera aphanis]
LRGVGAETGPNVNQDCLITVKLTDGVDLSLTCGIVPDGTFPAPLTIGRSVLHQLGAFFIPDTDRVQLLKILGTPTLIPVSIEELLKNNINTWSVTEIANKSVRPQQDSKKIPRIEEAPPVPICDQKLIQLSKDSLRVKFNSLFDISQSAGSATRATGVKHDIVLRDTNAQHKSAPARVSPRDAEVMKQFIESGLKEGIIFKGQSPFSSRALLVPKDGKPKGRMVIDFRSINANSEKSAYPLPVAQDEIQKASGHKYYVKFDLKSGFYQIELTERAQKICSFVAPQGQYLFKVMPFGLTNAPATFQRAMDECLEPIRDITSNMIDDVITWGNTVKEAHKNADKVLSQFKLKGYKLNARKCAWFETQTRFLGHIIDRNGIRVDSKNIQAILERPVPRTVTEVRAFLNSCNYFRDYVNLFSRLAGPLYELTSLQGKNVPVELNEEQISAWKATRNALLSTPVLRPMDPHLPVIIDVDSSDRYTGGVLMQPDAPLSPQIRATILQPTMDGAYLRPVAYTSRKLTPTQIRYSAQEREALGIIQALQTWQD